MKVIKQEENPRRVICDNCRSELEYESDDIHIGALGCAYVSCPVCGEEIAIDDERYDMDLTVDNLEFPTHYWHYSGKGVVKMSHEEINEYVRELIQDFRNSKDPNDWVRYTGSGDTFIIVFRFGGDEEYQIVVAKNYFDTNLPFQSIDYREGDLDLR